MAITYPSYLKSSGGNWNNIGDMCTDIRNLLNAGTLSQNLEVRVENGATFGNYTGSDMINLTLTNGKFNGFTITIHSDIVTPLSPGILKLYENSPVTLADSASNSDSGGLIIENLIIKQSSEEAPVGLFYIDNDFLWASGRYVKFQNNLWYPTKGITF